MCVCVCNAWSDRDPFGFVFPVLVLAALSRGQSHIAVDCPTERAAMWLIAWESTH